MNFDRVSSFYDQDIVPVWGRPFARILLSELPNPLTGTVLELGCGTGYLAIHLVSFLAERARIIGLEPSKDMLELAIERANDAIRKKKLFLQHNELKHLRFADQVVDLAFSNLGIYYLEQPDEILFETLRVLKPGGKAFFTLPLRESFVDLFGPVRTYLRELQEFDLAEHIDLSAMSLRSPEQALYLLRSAGFDSIEMKIHPFKMIFDNATSLIQSPFIRFHFLEEWYPYLQKISKKQFAQDLMALFELIRDGKPLELTVQAGCLIAGKQTTKADRH